MEDGRITGTYQDRPQDEKYSREFSLGGAHVYPCLIDSHVHLMFTIATAATGFPICEITADGVQPHNLSGMERKIRDYVKGKKKDELIAASNYILSAMEDAGCPRERNWMTGAAAGPL